MLNCNIITSLINSGRLNYRRARRSWLAEIKADVIAGTRRDAVLAACGANASHGLRRTNADKRRAVETLLRDEEWNDWSDRVIGRRCHVDHVTVLRIRGELIATGEIHQSTLRRGADGRTTDVSNIGKSKPDVPGAEATLLPLAEEEPSASESPPEEPPLVDAADVAEEPSEIRDAACPEALLKRG